MYLPGLLRGSKEALGAKGLYHMQRLGPTKATVKITDPRGGRSIGFTDIEARGDEGLPRGHVAAKRQGQMGRVWSDPRRHQVMLIRKQDGKKNQSIQVPCSWCQALSRHSTYPARLALLPSSHT